ncbi:MULTISPECIES: ATP-binding cassette domain-containing protein [unclassified Pseudofrankia]|uniref:ATP-binding cassette domain-containing protein n=1 Tax=unclassified Pseudofrankia TaxID=2994372 RepID=UPI0008D96D45|nr:MULTISPECIES: ATP-binding cassette domain-containing protein [unclassified Pseudofrankia]MDT3441512.1 ATP-binding cassette domain-containing protein [Pseudofrankia sp. BMG5.37]OHV48935.1 ABC transporter [Pseudofrankia sp. BMG5.36]
MTGGPVTTDGTTTQTQTDAEAAQLARGAVAPLPAGPSEAPRLACVGVTMRFGGLVAVDDVGLSVPPGQIVGLVGPNGAGKSTLFAVVSGLLRPTRGQVLLDGVDVTGASAQARAARGLARTFQHPELFTSLTVRDHLVLAHRVRNARRRVWSDLFTVGSLHRPRAAETDDVDGLLELLGLTDVAHHPAMGLPLGTARLVELGRALATSPTVLLLDEPSSGLDSAETEQLERVLRRATRERGISALLVEHDVELVMRLSSTIYVLDFGKLIASGTPEQVRADPTVQAAYLGEELADTRDTTDTTDTTSAVGAGEAADEADAAEAGDAVDASRERAADGDGPAGPAAVAQASAPGPALATARPDAGDRDAALGAGPAGGALLTVDGLAVRYGEALALGGVSFTMGTGTALAILGANGAGKSSLARAVSGLVPPSAGRVVFDGQDISAWRPHRIRRAALVHLPEGRGVFRGLTVIDNLRMAAGASGGRRARREAVDLALEIFPIFASRRRQVAGLLSGGEQQMLSLARALATSPKLVIADEMSLGLAPKMVDQVFDGLARARQAGVTVIMIEQYVHRALDFADECLVLQRGTVAWQGPTTDARGEVLRHYLGDATAADT